MRLNHVEIDILAIGDLHCPFVHQDALPFLRAVRETFGPFDETVFLGDEIDACALSRYAHDPDGLSPGDEHALAIDALRSWYKEFPTAKVCTSNHTNRPYRRAFDSGLPRSFLKEYRELLQAPESWEWAEFWDVRGIRFIHGEGFSGPAAARTAAGTTMMSTVLGHIHSHAGLQYIASQDKEIWGFNVGCLIDPDAYAFRYAAYSRYKANIGVGIIKRGYPIFVPMKLDERRRWIGIL